MKYAMEMINLDSEEHVPFHLVIRIRETLSFMSVAAGRKFTDAHFAEVADAVASNSILKHLEFPASVITEGRLALLAKGLRSNSILEELSIEDTSRTETRGYAIPNQLIHFL